MGITQAGSRPDGIDLNKQYKALKEQTYLLGGDIHLLYDLKDYSWFYTQHLDVLQVQIDAQDGVKHFSLFKDFERKIRMRSYVNTQQKVNDDSEEDDDQTTLKI